MQISTVNYRDSRAPKTFADSLHHTGFAVLSHHPIDPQLVADVYTEWYAFFHDPRRFDYLFDPEKQDGYIPPSLSETAKNYDKKDLKEFYHLYTEGRYPTFLSDKSRQLNRELMRLAQEILSWVECHTPADIKLKFSCSLPRMVSCERTLFRILHYPPLTGHEPPGALRSAPHADINLLTLLPAATAEGLEVLDSQGNWIPVKSDPGMLVVNIGDMLAECSEGWYRSTQHRVTNPVGEKAKQYRLSMPLFLHPRAEVILSPRYTADAYLQERLRELGLLPA